MQGRDDVAAFIAGFAGDDRYIVDYLAEEVLQRQPERVRDFLLQTSILDRLSGPLCDAVTGQTGGKAMLDALERGNLFLVPLDDRRRWYRYHHLFADVLQAHLLDEQPDRRSRAAPAGERRGTSRTASRPRRSATRWPREDFERAADLVELAIPETRRHRQEATLRRWLEALPDEVIQARPVLSNGYAGSILVRRRARGRRGAPAGCRAVAGPSPVSRTMVVADEEQFRALPAAIAVHRAGQARILGDVAGTMAHARRALDLVGEDDHVPRGAAAALLGLAYWTNGDLDAAHRWYAEASASLEKAGYLSDVIGCAIVLADIRIAQGRLREAMSTYERGLQLATEHAPPALRGAADMHVGMSQILRRTQ